MKENIWRRVSFVCGGEGKGGKYLGEKNIWPAEEKEKDEIIWKKKIFFGGGKERQKEKEANIW